MGQGLNTNLETIRLSRLIVALIHLGISAVSQPMQRGFERLVNLQKPDGGWNSAEETAWSLAALKAIMPGAISQWEAGCQWLRSIRLPSNAWGQTERDIPRIPTTALVCELVPELSDKRAIEWISREWEKDLKGAVQLSYKGGFFLLASGNKKEWIDSSLVDKTIEYLYQEQNDDGGFAPWKNHPVGSDPWSTGVVLWGLSKWGDSVDKQIFEKALAWLKESQLPSGVWPYHYLDDGASMAILGIVGAQKVLHVTV